MGKNLTVKIGEHRDEELLKQLTGWSLDRNNLEDCNETEKNEILAYRLKEISQYYFLNLDGTFKEMENKLTYDEAIVLITITNSLLFSTVNCRGTLIGDVQAYKQYESPRDYEEACDTLVNKLKDFTSMQVHVIHYMCSQFHKNIVGNFTEEDVKKYFNITKEENDPDHEFVFTFS